jgi:protein TonB
VLGVDADAPRGRESHGRTDIRRFDRRTVARLAPLLASLVLHVVFVGVAAIAVPGAMARVTDVIPVELVVIEPPPRVVEPPPAPPAPPKRLTLPKPIVAPRPKMDERQEPPREPQRPPEPVQKVQPEPIREAPPAPALAAAPSVAPPVPPVAPPAPAIAAPAPPATPSPAAAPSPAVSSPGTPAASAATGSGTESGVSWIGDGGTTRSSGVVASVPPGGGVTRVARPTGGYQVRPSYPASAARLGVQGTTILLVHVREDGRVGEIDVEQSAGHPDLDTAATNAVRRWRFEPARRGEQAVAMWVRLPVEFKLK